MKPVWCSVCLFALLFGCPALRAESNCTPLSQAERQHIELFVAAQYDLPGAATIAAEEPVGDSCYRALSFSGAAGTKFLRLYLSPDHRYLSSTLLDLTSDPRNERLRAAEDTLRVLLAEESPSRGPRDAPVTLVVFGDFQCPFCARLAELLQQEIFAKDDKSVRIVYKHLPLVTVHNWAMAAAEASVCVYLQQPAAFWQMQDFLLGNQAKLTAANIQGEVAAFVRSQANLDVNQFSECLQSKTAAPLIQRDIALAGRLNVQGTPTIFANGLRANGLSSPEQLHSFINQGRRVFASQDAAAAAQTPPDL
jgi:protein-disulfide isomerase